jgi:uncharacterized protein
MIVRRSWAGQKHTLTRSRCSYSAATREDRRGRPTPLILRYEEGDYNALHQDVYVEVGFPFQVLTVVSRREEDYTGGEFLLMTQRPRAQTVGEAINLDQGEILIFLTSTPQ